MEGSLLLPCRSATSCRREHHRGRCYQSVAQSIDRRCAVAQRQALHLDQYPKVHQGLSAVTIGPAGSGSASHCLSSSPLTGIPSTYLDDRASCTTEAISQWE